MDESQRGDLERRDYWTWNGRSSEYLWWDEWNVWVGIALAIREHFDKYLPYAMPMMKAASKVCAQMNTNDEEIMDYGNQLRHGIFEVYSGILQGFKNSKTELPCVAYLLQFIEVVFRDR